MTYHDVNFVQLLTNAQPVSISFLSVVPVSLESSLFALHNIVSNDL